VIAFSETKALGYLLRGTTPHSGGLIRWQIEKK
jgi:hypothetical protein